MSLLDSTLLIYLLIGACVAVAVYLSVIAGTPAERGFLVGTALFFWPLYIPLLLWRSPTAPQPNPPQPEDAIAAAISRVTVQLEAALHGRTEDLPGRDRDRLYHLGAVWLAQAERIRAMDRLLDLPE